MAPKNNKRAKVVPTLASRRSRRTTRPVERYGFTTPAPAPAPAQAHPAASRPRAAPPVTPKGKIIKTKTPKAPKGKGKVTSSTKSSTPPAPQTVPTNSSPVKAVTVYSGPVSSNQKSKSPSIKVESKSSSYPSPPAGTLFFGNPSSKRPHIKVEKKSPSVKRESKSPSFGKTKSPSPVSSDKKSSAPSSSFAGTYYRGRD